MNTKRLHFPLLIGDAATILIFTSIGMAEHQTGPTFGSVMVTALPLLIAWTLIGLWLKALTPPKKLTIAGSIQSLVIPWLLTVPIGMQLRVLLLQRSASFMFAVVTFLLGGLLLVVWRIIFTMAIKQIYSRRTQQ